MKSIHQLIVSTAALTGLLFGVASHAAPTPLAELPLNASVLAKPNVIFGMDDSGSMDWDVLLDTSSGVVWWNGATSFDTATSKPLRTSGMVPYVYLFPVGTATGGAIYAYNSWYGQAVPPTTQFAWVRSKKFNPLYYDSTVTYPAWSPAYLGGASVTYANAATNAAPSHPAVAAAQTLNVGADWSSANGSFTSNGYRFYVQAGMTLPPGTVVNSTAADGTGVPCGGVTQTLTASQTVTIGWACWASIPYFPASFWNAETCATNGTTCVTAPDGVTTLKLYEIKASTASYPSGRTHANELQNFANWFTYYRKRKLMMAGAMGRVLENLTGLRLGVMPFNQSPTITMYDADSTVAANNRRVVAGQFYLNSMVAAGTPTHATMKRIGTQFNTNTSIVQYACQRNSMFILTDGFANSHSETAPSYNSATYGAGAPYTTTYANSLADFALGYYTNQLRTDLPAGRVSLGSATRVPPLTNTNLHITTYGLTLGARGTLFPSAADPFATDVWATPVTWPTPIADDPTMIDDLWHATVNGRGRMYMGNDVEALRINVQSAFNDILNQTAAQSSVSVSSVNLSRGDGQAYLGEYNPRGWSGDLKANPIDINTAVISTSSNWSAASVLAARAWSTRVIFSSSGSAGVDFDATNVGAAVNPAPATYSNSAVVGYLRGDRSAEGTTFRTRTSLIGPVVNAEPVLARAEQTIYLASGDGMLHALDTVTGVEQWAYVPPDSLAAIGRSVDRAWVYQTLLDASPTYAKLGSGAKLLVGGLGAAGRSYYALDVSSPRNLNSAQAAAQFRWVFPAASDTTNRNLTGYTMGRPVVAKLAGNVDVVLVTSGYDNGQSLGDGRGRLWVLNATTGAVIKSFRTTGSVGSESGLAHVAAFKEVDGTARYVYGGDLLGNLWEFDLNAASAIDINATLVATFKDSSGNTQPVTSAPELVKIGAQRVVLVGTGRLLDITDFGSTRTQTFYAVSAGATLSNARTNLVQQVYSRATDTITSNPVSWSTSRGWYVDLPAGEQANTDPVVIRNTVAFATNVNGSSDCTQASNLYQLNFETGSAEASAMNGTGLAGRRLSLIANTSRTIGVLTGGGPPPTCTGPSCTAPPCPPGSVVTLNRLTNGDTVLTCGAAPSPITPSKNAWREIRR